MFNDASTNTINLADDKDNAKKTVKPFTDLWTSVVAEASSVENTIQSVRKSSNPMSTATSSFGQILSRLQSMRADVKQLTTLYPSTLKALRETVQKAEKSKVDSLVSVANKCSASLSALISDISETASVVGSWLQFDVPNQTEANLEFTGQVKRLLLEDVPDYTEVDLRYSGARQPGDQVYFEAELENEDVGAAASSNSIQLERRMLTMFQVDAHAKLAAGVMFLSPFDKSKVAFIKQFQAAPSYNFMAKWGSRSCYAYNTFWSLGVGMSIAAPDFNLDGTPEIGYGLVISTANDYLQVGLGRNFGVESWYWFFGVQLPVGTVINPTSTLSTEK
jgi:hypothetical protein